MSEDLEAKKTETFLVCTNLLEDKLERALDACETVEEVYAVLNNVRRKITGSDKIKPIGDYNFMRKERPRRARKFMARIKDAPRRKPVRKGVLPFPESG